MHKFDFKAGDRVRAVGGKYDGCTGVVQYRYEDVVDGDGELSVLDDGISGSRYWPAWFTVPEDYREIDISEIQVGDLIEVTKVLDFNGDKSVCTGVVTHIDSVYIETYSKAFPIRDTNNVTFMLINRPGPKMSADELKAVDALVVLGFSSARAVEIIKEERA